MKLFKIENYQVVVEPEVFTLLPFKALLKRDKTRNKEIVFKELAFIYHYKSVKSDFIIITDDDERITEIKKRVGLDPSWKIDSVMTEAIELFAERSITSSMKIFNDTMKGALDMGEYLADSKTLLKERTQSGGVVTTPATLASSMKAVSDIILILTQLERKVIKEQQDNSERVQGSRTLALFEDGHNILELGENEE